MVPAFDLVAWAENDPISRFAETLYDALRCSKRLVRFTAAEGAGGHCEESVVRCSTSAYDWLDEVFASVR